MRLHFSKLSDSLETELLVRNFLITYIKIFELGYVFEAYDMSRKCRVAVKRTQKMGNIISREYELLDMLRG